MDNSIISYIPSIVIFFGLLVAIRQLRILGQSYRFNTAPFVTIDIEARTSKIPPSAHLEEHIIKIDELSEWAKAKPRAKHKYMVLRLQNKQKHIAGAATDVRFRMTFKLPEYGTPNTMIVVSYRSKGEIFLEPDEIYRFVFADLKGVDTAVIDVDKIEYYDVDNNKYKRSYGFCHWELDNRGTGSWKFRAC